MVAIGDRAIAFPSVSGNGKTTLTAACLLSGFSYISDEALVLDGDGAVIPYPKPLALSKWSCETLGIPEEGEETLVTAADLGADVAQGGIRVTDVVVAEFGRPAEEPFLFPSQTRFRCFSALPSTTSGILASFSNRHRRRFENSSVEPEICRPSEGCVDVARPAWTRLSEQPCRMRL